MAIERMMSAASAVIEPPDLWEKRLSRKFSDLCPRLLETGDGVAWAVAGKIGPNLDYDELGGPRKKLTREDVAGFSTSSGRLAIQERDGVDGEVLYSVGKVWDLINHSGSPDFIRECYSAYNDWLAELVSADPLRFVGAAKIPTTGIEDATAELKRAGEKGLRGTVLDVWPAGAGTPPGAKQCSSFWEAAAALKMPVSVYTALNGEKTDRSGIEVGESPEFIQDMSAILFANVFDRYPDLQMVSVSPNVGWAPHLFESMNESYMRTAALRKVNLGNSELLPSDYLRRFIWFTTQSDRVTIMNRSYFGAAHLMWGSFAFMPDSVWPNTRQLFERITAGVPDEERQVLAADVTARLYGVGNAKPFTAEEKADYKSYGLL